MKSLLASIALLTVSLSIPAAAAGLADQISVEDAYVRMVPAGAKVTAAFMTLKNTGEKEAKLVSASSSLANTTELHNHINENGMMRMRQVKEITIPAKGELALKPGSYHVMMIDVKTAPKEGEHVVLTLGFADGSSKEVHAVAQNPMAGSSPKAMDHSKMHH